MMKLCCACNRELSEEAFSGKQWRAKKIRRCKECIEGSRPKMGVALSCVHHLENENKQSLLEKKKEVADEEDGWAEEKKRLIANTGPVEPIDEVALFEQPPPTDDCRESFFSANATWCTH